jgi:hypothetical protein
MSSSADPSPPILNYASPSTHHQVLYTRSENGATVAIHDPARRRRAVSEAVSKAVVTIVAIVVMSGCFMLTSGWGIALFLYLIFAALTLVPIVAWGRNRHLAQPALIEWTGNDLIFFNLDAKPPLAIPRDQIDAIRCDAKSKFLMVRGQGSTIFAHQFSLPAETIEEIAAFLRSVLNLSAENKAPHE